MQKNKTKLSQSIAKVIYNLSKVLFNANAETSELKNAIGLNKDEVEQRVKQIVEVLPDYIFELSPDVIKELQDICARELIFFQVQEKDNEKGYEHQFNQFVRTFKRDIKRRFPAIVS